MMRRGLVAGMMLLVSLAACGCCVDCHSRRTVLPGPGDCVGGGCHTCDDCGGRGCGTCRGLAHSPVAHVRHMFSHHAGCGEVYWDEWASDPPDCKDPCDDCGNWVGPRAGGRPSLLCGWRNLWGYRHHDGHAHYHGGHTQYHGGLPRHGETIVGKETVIYDGPADGAPTVEETPKVSSPTPSVLRRSAATRPYYVPRTTARPLQSQVR